MQNLLPPALAVALAVLLLAGCGAQPETLAALDKCNQDYRTLAERMAARPAASPAPAAGGGEVIHTATIDMYAQAITDAGFSIIGRTDRFIQFDMGGFRVQLFPRETSAWLLAGFTADGRVLPGRINEWNRTKRFSRAYLDGEGDPIIESDIDLEGGITQKAMVAWIRTFAVSLAAFNRMLVESAEQPSL
ncbi:MAG: YbjN domain-containing protein [bacterium]